MILEFLALRWFHRRSDKVDQDYDCAQIIPGVLPAPSPEDRQAGADWQQGHPDEMLSNVAGFILLYLLIFTVSGLLVTAMA